MNDFDALRAKSDEAITGLIREYNLAHSALTKRQLASAIQQALACGDFIRLVRANPRAESIIYMPYAREQELLGELAARGKCSECGCVLPRECDHCKHLWES